MDFVVATAQNLQNSLSGDWAGWSVELRNAEGKKYLSLSILSNELIRLDTDAGPDLPVCFRQALVCRWLESVPGGDRGS